MKKTTRHIFTLALCLALVLCMALPASATRVVWNENGIDKTMFLTISGGDGIMWVPLPGATYVQHTQNTGNTYLEIPTNRSVTVNATMSTTMYPAKLYEAMASEDAYPSRTYTLVTESLYFTVPSSAGSGEYIIGAEYNPRSGSWTIHNGLIYDSVNDVLPAAVDPGPESGTITSAPGAYYKFTYCPKWENENW